MKKLLSVLTLFFVCTTSYAADTLIAQGDGTTLGNLTEAGGLAASFDGNTNQSQGSCSKLTATLTGTCGKDWGVSTTHIISRVKAWSSNSDAWSTLTNGGTLTYTIKGSTDNFVTSNVQIGQTTGTMGTTVTETLDFAMSDTTTAYRYHRAELTSSNGPENFVQAEMEFYEDTGSSTANFFQVL